HEVVQLTRAQDLSNRVPRHIRSLCQSPYVVYTFLHSLRNLVLRPTQSRVRYVLTDPGLIRTLLLTVDLVCSARREDVPTMATWRPTPPLLAVVACGVLVSAEVLTSIGHSPLAYLNPCPLICFDAT